MSTLSESERDAICLRRNCARRYGGVDGDFITEHAADCDRHRFEVEKIIEARVRGRKHDAQRIEQLAADRCDWDCSLCHEEPE